MNYSAIEVMDYTPYALVLCACTALIVFSRLLRRGRAAQIVVPRSMVAATIGFAAGVGLGLGGTHALGYHWVAYKVTPFTDGQVAAGAVVPELTAGGWLNGERPGWLNGETPDWLNGETPDWSRLAGRVVVVDLWADW